MNSSSFLGLLHNVALLLALALIFDFLIIQDRARRQVLIGFLLGGIGVSVMLTPWVLMPGAIFDARSVLLGISGLFFGSVPTLIAMAITAIFRIYQGGTGALTGVLVILATGTIGIAWRHFRNPQLEKVGWKELYLFGVSSHLVMLALMLTFPWEVAQKVLSNISLPVLVLYPLGTVLLGMLMSSRLRREQTQEVLARTTARLNLTQNLVKMGGWEWDVKAKSMFWTDEVYRIHGLPLEESPSNSVELIELSLQCYDPDDRPIIRAAFQNCVEKSLPYDLELHFTTLHGERRWMHTRAEAITANGEVIRVIGNIMDITERKLAEEAKRESEAQYRRIVDTAWEGIWVLNAEQRTTFVNPHMAAMLGYEPGEMLGHPAEDFMFQEDVDGHYKRMQDRQMEQGGQYEQRFRNKEGHEVWTIVSASTLMDDKSRFEGSFAMFTDITDRKHAEEALRQSNKTIQAILNANTESIFLLDADDTVIVANETTALRLGTDLADMVGANIFKFLPPELAASRRKNLETARSQGISVQFEDTRAGLWFENYIHPIFDADGQVRRVAIYGRDITERKHAEENIQTTQMELKHMLAETERSRQALLSVVEDQKETEEKVWQLNAELEQRVADRTAQLTAVNHELEAFSYSVSHDLKSPLRTLDGFSSALVSDYYGKLDQQAQHYLTRIQEASHRMGQLIEDLLNLSRITRREINLSRVDLSSLAQQIADELQTQFPAQKMEFNISPGLVIRADPGLMKIAVENLLQNALKYSSKQKISHVQVGMLEQSGAEGRVFFVRDNGAGFDMAYANKLFTPFQRLHSVNEYAGTGIGLTIVQRIIIRHGGRIWPEAAVNQGATFYFTLGGEFYE